MAFFLVRNNRPQNTLLLCLAAVVLLTGLNGQALAALAQPKNAVPPKNQPPHQETRVLGDHRISQKGERYELSINYPTTGNQLVDMEIAIWVKNKVTTFVSGLDEIPPDNTKYRMLITYSVKSASLGCLSVIFEIETYTGGLNSESGLGTFTYDLSSGRRLNYQDIFENTADLLPFLSSYCRTALLEKLGEPFAESIIRGTRQDPLNFEYFALDGTGLVVYFPPDQVADYAKGEQEVQIPLTLLLPLQPKLEFWGLNKDHGIRIGFDTLPPILNAPAGQGGNSRQALERLNNSGGKH